MTSGAPWSVKGIDPKAREIAKDLARRSGMTLGEWLNQVILEDTVQDEPEPPYQGFDRRPPDRRQGLAAAAAPAYRRIETPSHPGDDVLGVREALDRLSARIEAAEHRSALAISGIDQSVNGLVSRLDGAEREQTSVAARYEGVADDLRRDQSRLTDRLRRMEEEAAGPRSAEALRAMEGALAKVASHLYEGEERSRASLGELRADLDQLADKVANGVTGAGAAQLVDAVVGKIAERLEQAEHRTTSALRSLESSFAQLDERLGAAEHRIEGRAADHSLEQLAASLSARVDAARAEMAEKIRTAADGRMDRVERTLQEMTGHVQAAERRSAEAIEKMGHEVLRMADALGRKVDDVEHRAAEAIDQVGGKVARMAEAMDNRLTRSDIAGAQALEKLGAEISRITDRLAERIGDADRRSAQAIDDMGERVSRVTDRIQDRQERASSELGDRIRQSEERTARLLEDARVRIDQRLAETNRRLEETRAAPPEPVVAHSAYADALFIDDVAPFGEERFDLEPRAAAPLQAEPAILTPHVFAGHAPEIFADTPFADEPFAELAMGEAEPEAEDAPVFVEPLVAEAADEAFAPIETVTAEEAAPAAHAPIFDEAADAFAMHLAAEAEAEMEPHAFATAEAQDETLAAADPMEAMFAPPPPPLSTRDLIQQARAASRAAGTDPQGRRSRRTPEPANDTLFSDLGHGQARAASRRRASPLGTALMVSAAAAVISVGAAGYVILGEKPGGPTPARIAEALSAHGGAQVSPKAALSDDNASALAALALVPGGGAPVAAPAPAAPSADAIALFGEGAHRIESHDNTGVEALKKSANLGYAPAEFYLAKLYEEGLAGLKKDSSEARRWTERAAEGGDRKAMHNLALYYFEGTGGAKNTTTAAEWFRRAADLGLTDSQYNLGRLYEGGFGVAQNPAEAYKWFLIAAQSGDAESRNSALRLKAQLSPEAQAAAERAAQSFHAQTPDAPAADTQQAANASPTAVAQRALSRLGYYQGPSDGAASPALKFAITAYQRDQGLPATGALDPTLNDRLAMIAQ